MTWAHFLPNICRKWAWTTCPQLYTCHLTWHLIRIGPLTHVSWHDTWHDIWVNVMWKSISACGTYVDWSASFLAKSHFQIRNFPPTKSVENASFPTDFGPFHTDSSVGKGLFLVVLVSSCQFRWLVLFFKYCRYSQFMNISRVFCIIHSEILLHFFLKKTRDNCSPH